MLCRRLGRRLPRRSTAAGSGGSGHELRLRQPARRDRRGVSSARRCLSRPFTRRHRSVDRRRNRPRPFPARSCRASRRPRRRQLIARSGASARPRIRGLRRIRLDVRSALAPWLDGLDRYVGSSPLRTAVDRRGFRVARLVRQPTRLSPWLRSRRGSRSPSPRLRQCGELSSDRRRSRG